MFPIPGLTGLTAKLVHCDNQSGDKTIVVPDRFGSLGKLDSGRIELQLDLSENDQVSIVRVKMNRETKAKRISPLQNLSSDGYRCIKEIYILKTLGRHSELYTDPKGNNVLIVEHPPDGLITVTQLAVVTQWGQSFITKNVAYKFQCFRSEQKVVCPCFDEKWPQLTAFLRHKLNKHLDSLAKLPADEQATEEQTPLTLPNNHGLVLWFDPSIGVGAIQTPQGDAKVHWKSIKMREGGRRFIRAGEMISFASLEPMPAGQGTFKYEAMDVGPPHATQPAK